MTPDVENIIDLLGPREVLGQAIDLLMARDHLSRDAAFEVLVHGSSRSHRSVREIAAAVILQHCD
jgi:AmiR/NasT family two-component response regulator